MKRLFATVTVLLCLCVFTKSVAQETFTYSSKFEMGNAAFAQKVLDLWKDWDDNQFDRHDYLHDTVLMIFPDGTVTRGKAENLAAAKKFRGTFTKVKSMIHAVIPMRSKDQKEEAVLIWGHEDDTLADGKVVGKDLHEVWWFNKEGKVTSMRQWNAMFKE
ncbi:MAG: hypothetical protein Q7T76_14025 [Ferruginibacter sp.]|nr:hypothetical protein [Ferruginibacter sp.]